MVRSNLVSEKDHFGDGGKWTCGVNESKNRPLDKNSYHPFIVYSFGSNDNDIFENHLLSINKDIEVFVFDPTSNPLTKYNFRSYGLCGGESKTFSSRKNNREYPCEQLAPIMTQNNHTYVDILKIDIEGSEWTFIETTDWTNLKIGQLLIEIHDFNNDKPLSTLIKTYLTPLEDAGFLLFSIEPVCTCRPGQYELGFLHKDWHPTHGFFKRGAN